MSKFDASQKHSSSSSSTSPATQYNLLLYSYIEGERITTRLANHHNSLLSIDSVNEDEKLCRIFIYGDMNYHRLSNNSYLSGDFFINKGLVTFYLQHILPYKEKDIKFEIEVLSTGNDLTRKFEIKQLRIDGKDAIFSTEYTK